MEKNDEKEEIPIFESDDEFQENIYNKGKSVIVKSIWEGRKPTIYFNNEVNIPEKKIFNRFSEIEWKKKENKKYSIKYKGFKGITEAYLNTLNNGGIIRTKNILSSNLIFKQTLSLDQTSLIIKSLNKYQRFNHYPFSSMFTKKDLMLTNYKKFQLIFPKDFRYLPDSYLFPKEKQEIEENFYKIKNRVWIVKSLAVNRNRSAKLLSDLNSLQKKSVVCHLIKNLHILKGHRYEIKVYVLITSFSPLRVFMSDDGLVKFYSKLMKYSVKKGNKLPILSKYLLFKNNGNYEEIFPGMKWSLSELIEYFKYTNLNYEKVTNSIKDIIIKSILTGADKNIKGIRGLTKHKESVFELFSFNFIVDDIFNVFLLKINSNPNLSAKTDLELKIKSQILTDTLNIIGLVPYYHKKIKNVLDGSKQKAPKTLEKDQCYRKNRNEKFKLHENQKFKKPEINKKRVSVSLNNNKPDKISLENPAFRKERSSSLNGTQINFFFEKNDENILNFSVMNTSVSTVDEYEPKIVNIKTKICKEFDKTRNFSFDSDDYLENDYQEIIIETEDQISRSGNFNLIFPLYSNIEYYSKFLKDPKDENIVLWKWIMSGKPLDKLKFKKMHIKKV